MLHLRRRRSSLFPASSRRLLVAATDRAVADGDGQLLDALTVQPVLRGRRDQVRKAWENVASSRREVIGRYRSRRPAARTSEIQINRESSLAAGVKQPTIYVQPVHVHRKNSDASLPRGSDTTPLPDNSPVSIPRSMTLSRNGSVKTAAIVRGLPSKAVQIRQLHRQYSTSHALQLPKVYRLLTPLSLRQPYSRPNNSRLPTR